MLVTIAVARHLLPESFGKMSYLLALAALVTPIMAVGLNSIVTREVVNRPDDSGGIMASAFAIRCVVGLIVAPIVIWCGYTSLALEDRGLFTFLILSNLFNIGLVVDFWLQAHAANRIASMVRLTTLLAYSAARVVAIYVDAELSVFIILSGLEVVTIGVVYLLVYQRLSGGPTLLQVSWQESQRLLKDSIWLIFSGMAAMVYLKIDQVMLGILIDDQAVGVYAAAARLSEVWYFFPTLIMTSFFPQLLTKRTRSPIAYQRNLQMLNDGLLCAALVVALFITMFAKDLVPLLFGEGYKDAIPILRIHIWVGLFVFMRALLSKWLIAENLLKLSLLSQLLGAVVNVIVNIQMIPLYGPLGAAYATVISYCVVGYGVLFLHRDLWPMAMVVTRSIFLPLRLVRYGRNIYREII